MKMKNSLSTSISCLIICSGEQRRSFCSANGFSTSLQSILFNTRPLHVFGCQWQGLQSLRTFSSYIEDDFDELGPPSEGLATQIKLQTQKPELRMRNNCPAKELNRSSSLGSRSRMSSIFSDILKPSKTSTPSLQDHKSVSVQPGDKKNRSKVDSSSVKAEDVTDGVEKRATDSKIVKIIIKDIAKGTTYDIIHSICKSIGVLEGFAKTDNAFEVHFRVNNDTDSQCILKRLNTTVIDESKWSAFELAKKNSTPSSSSSSSLSLSSTKTIENARCKTCLQISNALFDLKQQMAYKRILYEDLELMHMSVMHLEGLPTIVDPSV